MCMMKIHITGVGVEERVLDLAKHVFDLVLTSWNYGGGGGEGTGGIIMLSNEIGACLV